VVVLVEDYRVEEDQMDWEHGDNPVVLVVVVVGLVILVHFVVCKV